MDRPRRELGIITLIVVCALPGVCHSKYLNYHIAYLKLADQVTTISLVVFPKKLDQCNPSLSLRE